MREDIIARTTQAVRSILNGAAYSTDSWSKFKKEVENNAWMAFPEKSLEDSAQTETSIITTYQVSRDITHQGKISIVSSTGKGYIVPQNVGAQNTKKAKDQLKKRLPQTNKNGRSKA